MNTSDAFLWSDGRTSGFVMYNKYDTDNDRFDGTLNSSNPCFFTKRTANKFHNDVNCDQKAGFICTRELASTFPFSVYFLHHTFVVL